MLAHLVAFSNITRNDCNTGITIKYCLKTTANTKKSNLFYFAYCRLQQKQTIFPVFAASNKTMENSLLQPIKRSGTDNALCHAEILMTEALPSLVKLIKEQIMNRLINKLMRMLTAIACAEAGDLDTVKKMLQEDSEKSKYETNAGERNSRQPAVPAI